MAESTKQLTLVDELLLKTEHAQRYIEANRYFLSEGLIHQSKLQKQIAKNVWQERNRVNHHSDS